MNLLIQNLKTKAKKYQRKCNSYIQGILFNSKKEKQFHATRWIQVKLLYSIKKKNPSTKDQILHHIQTTFWQKPKYRDGNQLETAGKKRESVSKEPDVTLNQDGNVPYVHFLYWVCEKYTFSNRICINLKGCLFQ